MNRSASTAGYWTATFILAAECLGGGVMGALQLPALRDTATHLGYPSYFMSILGVWYVAAGLILLAPRLPRLSDLPCSHRRVVGAPARGAP